MGAQFWQSVRDEVEGNNATHYVASSEYIHSQIGNNIDAIKNLHAALTDIFGQVKVILYLREQLGFLKSVYSQNIKGPLKRSTSFDQFIADLDSISDMFLYAETVKRWREVFGAENVEPVVFNKENFPNNNVIEDFCNRIDIDFETSWYSGNAPSANVSPNFSTLQVLRHFNRLPGDKNFLMKVPYKVVLKLTPDRGFPTKYDDEIMQRITPGNTWLNQTFFSNSVKKLPVLE